MNKASAKAARPYIDKVGIDGGGGNAGPPAGKDNSAGLKLNSKLQLAKGSAPFVVLTTKITLELAGTSKENGCVTLEPTSPTKLAA